MIEIRVEETSTPVSTDGPHSADGTRAIAAGIDEAFRLLNYATMSKRGLIYPGDVYGVLGDLSAAVSKVPQALRQMSEFLTAEIAEGYARENPDYGDHNGNTEAAHRAMIDTVRDASALATQLGITLDKAQSSVRGLESTRDEDDE